MKTHTTSNPSFCTCENEHIRYYHVDLLLLYVNEQRHIVEDSTHIFKPSTDAKFRQWLQSEEVAGRSLAVRLRLGFVK